MKKIVSLKKISLVLILPLVLQFHLNAQENLRNDFRGYVGYNNPGGYFSLGYGRSFYNANNKQIIKLNAGGGIDLSFRFFCGLEKRLISLKNMDISINAITVTE